MLSTLSENAVSSWENYGRAPSQQQKYWPRANVYCEQILPWTARDNNPPKRGGRRYHEPCVGASYRRRHGSRGRCRSCPGSGGTAELVPAKMSVLEHMPEGRRGGSRSRDATLHSREHSRGRELAGVHGRRHCRGRGGNGGRPHHLRRREG